MTHLAISLIERRLRDAFGREVAFTTYGIPKTVDAARDLAARDKHEFEKWAVTLVPDAQPFRGGRKGPDSGIDGIVYLRTGRNKADKAIVEVKGGGVSVDQIHKLKSVVEREKALIGIFVTLNPPTKPMVAEAVSAGFVEVDMGTGTKRFPVIQILTIEDILERYKVPSLPLIDPVGFQEGAERRIWKTGELRSLGMTMRPYRSFKIDQLEREFDLKRNDGQACEYLARELALRKQTPRVKDLHRRVVQRISSGFRREDPVLPVSAPRPVKRPREPWWKRIFGQSFFRN